MGINPPHPSPSSGDLPWYIPVLENAQGHPVHRRNPLPPAPLVVAARPLLRSPSIPLLSWCREPYLVIPLRRNRLHWVLVAAWSPLQTPQYSVPRTLRRFATVGRSFTLVRARSLIFWAVVGRISPSPPSCAWDSQNVK